jgi:hypothetical protein
MSKLFDSIFGAESAINISVKDFLFCVIFSLILGFVAALAFSFKSRTTKSFFVTLSILPAVVCVVIMMVNGNVGTGVAVAGAFSLVRFRSAPGSAKEIGMIFLCMGAGLITGMGYLGFAAVFTLIISAVFFISGLFEGRKSDTLFKTLSVTIPEDLNYTEIFDDIFAEYTKKYDLVRVKTTNMGSLFRLTYDIVLRDAKKEKEMLDRIRERNGNLEISISRMENPETRL